jgi:hypothetical protein
MMTAAMDQVGTDDGTALLCTATVLATLGSFKGAFAADEELLRVQPPDFRSPEVQSGNH